MQYMKTVKEDPSRELQICQDETTPMKIIITGRVPDIEPSVFLKFCKGFRKNVK
jgi:hypothetical protein